MDDDDDIVAALRRGEDGWEYAAADEIEALRAENARLKEALGLITTLAPTMEINPDDPIGMARNIVAEVSDNMARLRGRAE